MFSASNRADSSGTVVNKITSCKAAFTEKTIYVDIYIYVNNHQEQITQTFICFIY